MLCALEDVDTVTFFEEDTPIDLIRKIKPDILVKGADYTLAEVVGHEIVESYGGKIHLANLLPGYSTSGIVEKLASSGIGG
jgi:D-beta-D-heptose 7-phosphate kinase/D-beta-D-heptose 1-phosphate adenosyltransferase